MRQSPLQSATLSQRLAHQRDRLEGLVLPNDVAGGDSSLLDRI